MLRRGWKCHGGLSLEGAVDLEGLVVWVWVGAIEVIPLLECHTMTAIQTPKINWQLSWPTISLRDYGLAALENPLLCNRVLGYGTISNSNRPEYPTTTHRL
jgi:hypothetical protein